MEWKLFANLAETAGGKRVDVDVEPGATVDEALTALLDARPELEADVVDDGELNDHINILRNGKNVMLESGLDTEIEAGDELALFPPVSGGSR